MSSFVIIIIIIYFILFILMFIAGTHVTHSETLFDSLLPLGISNISNGIVFDERFGKFFFDKC